MAAIYQWFYTVEEVYTTTLYPLETTDTMTISADFVSGYMDDFPSLNTTIWMGVNNSTLEEKLSDTPIIDITTDLWMGVSSGTLEEKLSDTPTIDLTTTIWMGLANGTLEAKLIEVYSPDFGGTMEMSANLVPGGSCYLIDA
jgi:hypothetical protein